MTTFLKIILILSLIFNLFAIWGLFHYVMYGGSPLSELKRKILGGPKAVGAAPYEDDIAGIKKEVAEGKFDSLRVVFYGASITHNWDLKKYFPEIHPVNRGVGGFVQDLVIKFKSNVLDLKPRAVVIKLCSINFRPQIPMYMLKDGMAIMVTMAKDAGITPIMATVIPAGKPAAHIGDFNVADSLAAFNDWARQYAAQNSVVLIDYARAIQDENGFLPRDCSIDPVHVNDKGYGIMAEAARPIVDQVVGIKQ